MPLKFPLKMQKNAQDRVNKIQEYTAKLKGAEGIADFEKEPAYKRRSIELDDSKLLNLQPAIRIV